MCECVFAIECKRKKVHLSAKHNINSKKRHQNFKSFPKTISLDTHTHTHIYTRSHTPTNKLLAPSNNAGGGSGGLCSIPCTWIIFTMINDAITLISPINQAFKHTSFFPDAGVGLSETERRARSTDLSLTDACQLTSSCENKLSL